MERKNERKKKELLYINIIYTNNNYVININIHFSKIKKEGKKEIL